MSTKRALIIANTEYIDSGFGQLRAPGKDADSFAQILSSPHGCAFDEVNVLLNKPEFEVREAIDEFFDNKKPDDLLLLYFSGHGIRDDVGALYLAVRNTTRSRLRATALKSDFIRESMDGSRSKRQVLILDCCYSGAFAEGTKAAAGGSVGTASAFEGTGYGRVVLTASDATQFAWEGDKVIGTTENSLFTHFLIKGLEGEADRDNDGEITVDDLYEYAYEQVITITPRQRPGKWSYKQHGDLTLREISEAEKERRLKQKLEAQEKLARQAQEEAVRLAQIEAERQKEYQTLKAATEAAEQAAREAAERALQETARREALEQEMARRRSEQEQAEKAAREFVTPEAVEKVPAVRAIAGKALSRKIVIPFAAVIGLAAIFFSARLWLPSGLLSGTPLSQPSSVTPASNGGDGVELAGVVPTPIFSLPYDSALPIDSMAVISEENVSEIRGLTRWGGYIVNNMAVSPDGSLVAVASSIGVHIYDADSLEEIRFLETGDWVNCVVFSPDGKQVVSGSNRDRIRVWNVDSGELIKTLAYYYSGSSDVMDLLYLEDDFLVVGYQSGIALFDLKKSMFVAEANWYGSDLSSITLSPDGKTMASLSYGEILLWTLEPGSENAFTLIRRIEQDFRGGQKDVQFSPDGQLILATSQYYGTKIWRVSDGIATTSLDSTASTFSPATNPGENIIAVALAEGGLRLDYPGTGKAQKLLDAGATEVSRLLFHPDGSKLFVIADNVLQNWDTSAGTLITSKQLFVQAPRLFAIPSDTSLVAAATYTDNHIRLLRFPSNELIREITASDERMDNLAISADGSILLSTNDTTIQLWDPASGELIKSMNVGDDGYIDSIAISPDNQMLAYSLDNWSAVSVEVLNIEDGSIRTIVDSATTDPYYYPLEFSPDGDFLAGASETLEIWDVQTGAQRQTTEEVSTFLFLPDGVHFAYATDKVYVANIADGTLVKTFQLPETGVGFIALSPDGTILAASTSDGFVYFWNYEDASLLTGVKVSSQRYGAPFVTFSSDGRFLITSSQEGFLAFWGIQE